jgi:hypothetical protein
LDNAIGGTDCNIYGYGPYTEASVFGWLIVGPSEIYCSPNPSGNDVLDSGIYEFYNWTWLHVNDTENSAGSGSWYAYFVNDFTPCYGYGTTSWVYDTQAWGAAFFGGIEYWGSTGGSYNSVSCSATY